MLEGFWTVVFQASSDLGAGALTIIGNKVFGGDTSFTYVGTITASNGNVSGQVQVNRHSDFLPSVIPGLDNYILLLFGKVSGDSLTLTGTPKGQESLSMTIQGTRRLGRKMSSSEPFSVPP